MVVVLNVADDGDLGISERLGEKGGSCHRGQIQGRRHAPEHVERKDLSKGRYKERNIREWLIVPGYVKRVSTTREKKKKKKEKAKDWFTATSQTPNFSGLEMASKYPSWKAKFFCLNVSIGLDGVVEVMAGPFWYISADDSRRTKSPRALHDKKLK